MQSPGFDPQHQKYIKKEKKGQSQGWALFPTKNFLSIGGENQRSCFRLLSHSTPEYPGGAARATLKGPSPAIQTGLYFRNF
jgi:hypothetical protein